MTVHHPYNPGEEHPQNKYAADEGGSFLALNGLTPLQRKCLVEIAERFAQDTHAPPTPPTPPSPPYDYYLRGRKDLQLVHDAMAWYSGELKKQYEATTINMIEGIMWEAIGRIDEMKQQLSICIDILGESDEWRMKST